MGDARNSHSISVEDELVIQKSMHRLALTFPISRTKRGGVEFILACCILLASLV